MSDIVLTGRGIVEGVRRIAPLMPGVALFASAFGAIAEQKGMTLTQALAMSATVYAGASQMVAMQVWPSTGWTMTGLIAVILVTALVNLRLLLMSAGLQPWLASLPPSVNYPSLLFLTDANYILGMRYRQDGGRDAGIMLGAGIALWLVWVLGTIPGHLAGSAIGDPKRFGLDLVMPVFFGIMLVPLWKGQHDSRAWGVAGLVALACYAVIPGHWYLALGAFAGMAYAAFDPFAASSNQEKGEA
jgi:predicted branched-subunit amino acid permease